ncbi:hypothetical protein [Segatella copri]|uniref:hypothetical protein n=1 Tax=Segatella copri TaxID=165179 RepID=UPI003981D25F
MTKASSLKEPTSRSRKESSRIFYKIHSWKFKEVISTRQTEPPMRFISTATSPTRKFLISS